MTEEDSTEGKQILNNFIERGYHPDQSIAAIGLSRQAVEKSIKEGVLTSFSLPDKPLPYQNEITEHGRLKLYYTNVLPKALHRSFLDIGREYDDYPDGDAIEQDSIDSLREYAFSMSLMDSFESFTGERMSVANMFYLLKKFYPDKYEALQEENVPSIYLSEDEIEMNADIDARRAVVTKVSLAVIKDILPKVFNERGMIVYINGDQLKTIMNSQEVSLMRGFEDDKELLIVTDNELPISIIDGIEDLRQP